MRQLKQLTFQSIALGRHLAEWRPCFLTLIVTVYPSICIVSVIGMCSPPLLGGVADRLAPCCHNHTIYDMNRTEKIGAVFCLSCNKIGLPVVYIGESAQRERL